MNTPFRHFSSAALALVAAGCFTWAAGNKAQAAAMPSILSITMEKTNVLVRVAVPAGLKKITLEGRSRAGNGPWEPRVVARVAGTGGAVTLRLAPSRQIEVLRVRADASEPLPTAFYEGTNSFAAPPSGAATPGGPGAYDGAAGGAPRETDTRDVTESDIWKIQGDRLYFFNQLRGLQVIDISDPDHASVRGLLSLPAAGDQMYVLDPGYVVLLARESCGGSDTTSQVLVVDVSGDQPNVVVALPFPGYLIESRLVGTALYVASQSYRPVDGTANSTWEWGTDVTSFDLADPKAPVARDHLWYSGYGNVVSATDEYLFVATQAPSEWWRSLIRIVDITSPDGMMRPYRFGADGRPFGRQVQTQL